MPRLAHIPPRTQLQPINLVTPGFRGINLMQEAAILAPSYGTEAQNAVIDAAGRIATRAGITNVTSTPIGSTPQVRTLFEYRKIDGTGSMIIAWDGGIGTSVVDPGGTDISGAVTDANGNWFFQNFNNKVVGFQAGQKLIVYTGAGNFATVTESSGTAPSGGIGVAAYGRIWQVDSDQQTIKYSGLLNETQWASGGAGTIDMRNVWTQGTDVVTAIAAFNGALVVFGNNHIVFWRDSIGNVLGVDPTKLVVTDVIAGTGCVSQFSVQHVGQTDLYFLSKNGVQSLARLIIDRSSPVRTLSKYVRDVLLGQVSTASTTQIRSAYSPLLGVYLLSLPGSSMVWCFDTRHLYQDDDGEVLAVITRWALTLWSMANTQSNTLYVGRTGGKVGTYSGTTDEGATFRFIYTSPWLDLGPEVVKYLKMLKSIGIVVYSTGATDLVVKWATDFSTNYASATLSYSASTGAEYGTGEWGIAEYGGAVALRNGHVPARARGQFFRLSIEVQASATVALQLIELFAKIGRLA